MGFFLYDRNEYYNVLRGINQDDKQVADYKSLFKESNQVQTDIERYAETLPELPGDVAASLALAGVPPTYAANKEIAQEVTNNRIYNEAQIWQELQQKYQYEHTEDNMKMSIGDLLTGGLMPGGAKPGDVQYGVWAFAALDALFQTIGPSGKWSVISSAVNALAPGQPMKVGRSQAYLRDIRAYDKLLKEGVSPSKAQSMLQIDLSQSSVKGLGEELGGADNIRKYMDMVSEAHKMGGEPVLANMWRNVVQGKPLNFDRATKITLESVKAENTPYYIDLTQKYGMSPEQASDFIYKHIGEPIKNFDENGEIHYTSAYNPNKINFYAGRARQRYFWQGQTEQDYYRPDWANRDILLEYSPGKVTAAEFYEPGTKAFEILSGATDAIYQFAPELFAAKGVRGAKNLNKSLRGVNKAFDLMETGRVKKTGKTVKISPRAMADDILETVGDEIDGLTGAGNIAKFQDDTGRFIKNKEYTKDRRAVRKGLRKIKKESTMFGRVPRFFQATTDDILNQPTNVEFFKTLAATGEDDLMYLATNPITKHLPYQIRDEITEIDDWTQIQSMFGDMIGKSGYVIKDAAGQAVPYTLPGKMLPKTGSLTINRALQKTGINPNAAYRTFGSWVGEKSRKVREVIYRKQPTRLIRVENSVDEVVDKMDSVAEYRKVAIEQGMELPEFERYLGFSSNFNSSYNPYFRKMLGVVPEMGIPLSNIEVGYRQLASHLQINGYDPTEASKILKEFSSIDAMDKAALRSFANTQAMRDVQMVKAKGGNFEYVAEAAKSMFEGQNKMKIYATGKNKKILPNIGSGFKGYEINDDGAAVFNNRREVQSMTASLFDEMQDNIAPLLDYRLLDKAMGRMFKPYEKIGDGVYKRASFRYDTQQWLKYHAPWSKNPDNLPNPFEPGVISVKRLENNFGTNLANFYTRNVFKPLVLMRFAFFTRVFLEEQARIAVKGLAGFYNKPHEYLQWIFAHNPNSKAGAMLEKISLGKYSKAKQNNDAVEFLMQEEVIEAMQKTFRPTDIADGGSRRRNKYLEYLAKEKSELNIDEIAESIYAELRHLRNDPIAQQVAKFGYGTPELNEWILSAAGRQARLDLVKYGGNKWSEILRDGSETLDQHLQFLESRIRISAGGQITEGKDIFKQADGTYKYKIRLNTNTGNQNIRKMIGEGKLAKFGTDGSNEKDIIEFFSTEANLTKRFKKAKVINELKLYYNKTDGLDPGMMTVTRNLADEATDKNFLGQFEDAMDVFYQTVFDHLMTKPIGILNRSTTFKQFRWMFIGERFEDFSRPLRQKFINEAIDASVPKKVIDELKAADKLYAPGKIDDYQAMNTESKAYGLAGVKELLYDTKQRHTISDKLVNVFPFAEVWFEVFQTWGKLLAENPYVLRKGHVGFRGGSAADALGSSSNDGLFVPNPQDPTEDMFVYPWGGFMSNLIFDDEFSDGEQGVQISPRGYVQGVNLLGQGFVPGPNPFVAFAIDRVLPPIENASTKMGAKYGWANSLEKFLFGEFPPPKKMSDIFAISPVYKKLNAWLFTGADDFDVINDSSTEAERMRAKATIDIFRWGVSAGEPLRLYQEGKLDKYIDKLYPGTAKGQLVQGQIEDAYMEYAKHKSGTLFGFQFLYQFFGPTGFQPEYFVDDEQGNLWGQSVLYEEYIRIREKNNQNDIATYNEFFELYGVEHPYMLSPRSQSEVGRQPYSVRVQQWQKENAAIFDSLDISGYYLNIDNPFEEKSYDDIIYEKSLLSPDQYRRSVNDTIGFFRYKTFTKNLDKLAIPSLQKTLLKRVYREELKIQLPGFQADEYGLLSPPATKDIFNEMKTQWRNNPAIMEYDAAKGFAEAMVHWEEASRLSEQYSPTKNPDWWLTSDDVKAKGLRIWMYNKANLSIEKYPDFWPVWTGVMLKLYRDDQEYLDYLPEG